MNRIGEDYCTSQWLAEEYFFERCTTWKKPAPEHCLVWKAGSETMQNEVSSRWIESCPAYFWRAIVFKVKMVKDVLVIQIDGRERVSNVTDILALIESVDKTDKQTGRLSHFHQRFGHVNYDTIERITEMPDSEIEIDDHRRPTCNTSAENKQTKNKQLRDDTGKNLTTERIGVVISSDLKDPSLLQTSRSTRKSLSGQFHRL